MRAGLGVPGQRQDSKEKEAAALTSLPAFRLHPAAPAPPHLGDALGEASSCSGGPWAGISVSGRARMRSRLRRTLGDSQWSSLAEVGKVFPSIPPRASHRFLASVLLPLPRPPPPAPSPQCLP